MPNRASAAHVDSPSLLPLGLPAAVFALRLMAVVAYWPLALIMTGSAVGRDISCVREEINELDCAFVFRLGNSIMTRTADRPNFQPGGWHTVTPRIIVKGAEQLVGFMKDVFGATGDYRPEVPAEMRLGDSIVMISEAGVRDPSPACLYVYVENADLIWRRAVEAGAKSIEAPADTPYGDRRGMVKDAWGNTWQIATRK